MFSTQPISFQQIFGVLLVVCILASLYLALWTGLDTPRKILTPDPLDLERILIRECHYNEKWAAALYATEVIIHVIIFSFNTFLKIKIT